MNLAILDFPSEPVSAPRLPDGETREQAAADRMSSASASYAASAASLPPEPSPRALMEQALFPHVLLGMPHLAPTGLSETWLMKELGHRHWLMLARHLGMENASDAEVFAEIRKRKDNF